MLFKVSKISILNSQTDILLNVFLAIAVDNLADAESLTNIEKEEGVSNSVWLNLVKLCLNNHEKHHEAFLNKLCWFNEQ